MNIEEQPDPSWDRIEKFVAEMGMPLITNK